MIRRIVLPSGEKIPVLGQGTWHLAEVREQREAEIAALRLGLELGMTLIDTAEMYAEGETERLVGDAIGGRRDQVFLISKVLPSHASHQGTIDACTASLRRLKTDRLDMYLLHWRGSVPLRQTIEAFVELKERGWIRHWGVSNFDVMDLIELWRIPSGPDAQTDQVLYNLAHRSPEYNLLPWCREQDLPVMSYSPMDQGDLLSHPAVRGVAERNDITPAQVALAWVLRQPLVCAIPKSGSAARVQQNAAAAAIRLSPEDLTELDLAFPPPIKARPLETL
ncbi:aldo/keto reductase [Actinoplanes siamensis]|uniref:aldo/keto reductase n=1 Tax=Actinoplanes siamensis TaxID=1223317 RepID=UPI0019458E98|nr:aldo/keto reductase [Actinoplanes siamensis]